MLEKSNKLISVFIVFGIFIQLASNVFALNVSQSKNSLKIIEQLEDSVFQVAENVGSAVVGISTQRNRLVTSYFRKYGDEFFNEFFQTFFFGDSSQREYKQIGLGSGVIINPDGHILTNEHVIAGADKIKVTLADGREFEAELKGADYRSDIALIKINALDLPYAELGDSDALRTGQWAIAIGNPFSFAISNPKPVVTFGIISALARTLLKTNHRSRAYLDLIQTDAAINSGNSGGPLVSIQGEVIGINAAILNTGGSDGIGFAIPINDAKIIIENLLRGEKLIYRWIGISIQDINHVMAEYFDLKKAQGALVLKVSKNSQAEAAGLCPQDIIMKFNSEKVENSLDFIKKISRVNTGDIIKLKIFRNSLPRTIIVKLNEKPKELELSLNQKPPKSKKAKKKESPQDSDTHNNKRSDAKTPLKTWRGMKVAEITKEFADNFQIETYIGVIVTKVIAGTPAEGAGIRVKDIITQINTSNIQTLEDYLFAISKSSGKVLIKTNRAYLMIQEQ